MVFEWFKSTSLLLKYKLKSKLIKMYEFDNNGFMEIIKDIMSAPKGTLAHKVRDDWALVALEMNIDKLYESSE